MSHRKMRMGMVGGSLEAFIGGVHRRAAVFDGEIELVCGAFSSDPEKSKQAGYAYYLPDERVYGSFHEMISEEKKLPQGERMDFVSIVTPNHMHFEPAKLALENGFHVMCDKPMTLTLQQATELAALVKKTGLLFGLTHNYTGYPLVKEARSLIQAGQLGKLRKVIVEYSQGWLSTREEDTDYKQAIWRTDPAMSGPAGCMGDIGTHAQNLAEYITGLRVQEVSADLSTFVDGRRLDDDGNLLMRFQDGVKGILQASQIANGEENALSIRIYGEAGGLEWHQMNPNTLLLKSNDGQRIIRPSVGALSPAALAHIRLPSGHPEGFFEAFANLYRNFAFAIRSRLAGQPANALYDFPSVEEGVRGLAFIETVLESNRSNSKWTLLPS